MVGGDLARGIDLLPLAQLFSRAFWEMPLKAMSASVGSRRKWSVLYLVKAEIRKSTASPECR
jgi:hypothetical protein